LEEARRRKDAYAQFEIGFGRAALAAENTSKLQQLRALESTLENPVTGMTEPDRHISWATVVREEARIAALSGQTATAEGAISRLERSASETRDLVVANS